MTTATILVVAFAALAAAAIVATVLLVLRRPGDGPDSAREITALVEAHGVRVERLADALGRQSLDDQAVREGVVRVRAALEEMRLQAEERRRFEERGWEAVRRLESVLVGGSARGRAGENVLEEALGELPAGMMVRDFRVNGRVVEFALVLPDGRRLPVDSKWTAVPLLEALDEEQDPGARDGLSRKVEDEVVRRAREVSAYLEPSLTTPFAVACVPDAAYGACRRAHAEAYGRGVVLVPYSTALPVLLSLYALAARHGGAADAQACLAELDGLVEAMELTLENKLARATTMLQNAADEWRTTLGKARGALARGRGAGGPTHRSGTEGAVADGNLVGIRTEDSGETDGSGAVHGLSAVT
jgi:DNA recombination protein RmuC